MPANEVEICKRIKEFRMLIGLSRVMFARKAGIDSSQIANYEHGRSPLRFGDAHKIILAFDLNPRWLATGQKPVELILAWTKLHSWNEHHEALFSDIYQRFFKHSLEFEHGSMLGHLGTSGAEIPIQLRVNAEIALISRVQEWTASVRDARLPEFVSGLCQYADEFFDKEPMEHPNVAKRRRLEMDAIKARAAAGSKSNKKGKAARVAKGDKAKHEP